jgi:hypothetical protein
MSDDNWYDPKPPTLEECARVVKSLTICINFLKGERLRERTDTTTNRNATPSDGSVQGEGTLTDAERDALEFAVETGRVATHDTAILRTLLERLK